ncbi:MAG: metallophosphoesterase [Planctomycetes bacterium]|nr:metallophosphoesterase [Planctomycetota bacterium]
MQRPADRLATLALAFGLAAGFGLPVRAQSPRLHTDRPTGSQLLRLPKEDDAFGFVVFGDRTGGPPDGIEVLDQAVRDANLLDPDLVFTVGDLVNGYNDTPQWLLQAAEFKASMNRLRMPWFPVAGNHDIYWRGNGERPEGEHEGDYEAEFGPLWYALQHKRCWFIVLYSDEGDPETGEKNFDKPACQRMSPAQMRWLEATLRRAKDARHVFVFLHHPRWLPRYGDDWDRVHALLVESGNVAAVFAGHIHRMRYDGVVDGIRYYTVASVGAHLAMDAPQAGYLHQFHAVTVRPEGITTAALPVGAVMDPEAITGQISEDVELLAGSLRPVVHGCVSDSGAAPVAVDGAVAAITTLSFDNPASRPIELEVVPLLDPTWQVRPDHQHVIVPPGGTAETTFRFLREAAVDEPFGLPRLQLRCDYLAPHGRIGLPLREHDLLLPPPADLAVLPTPNEGVLVLDGRGACLEVGNDQLNLPDGPMTVELWLCGDDVGGRRAVLTKTQQSEFGLFGSDGVPEFSILLGSGYCTARATDARLVRGRWHHLAGVFDGAEVRCYLDGKLVAAQPAAGRRRTNELPLFVGADPTGSGAPTSFFDGRIDEARISKVARYTGESFAPPPRHEPDAETVLLLHLDADFGPWTPEVSAAGAHPLRRGTAHCTVESRPAIR